MMSITKYQKTFRTLSFLLAAFCLLQLLGLIFVFLLYFSDGREFKLNNFGAMYTFFNFGYSRDGVMTPQSTINLASLITLIPYTLIVMFVSWWGSSLLAKLSQGGTPFSKGFALGIQRLSKVLMVTDILYPLAYSLVLSVLMPAGYNVQMGVSAVFLIGAIMYAMGEILKYGVELQKLSDDTV